jgi:hypothetical protein
VETVSHKPLASFKSRSTVAKGSDTNPPHTDGTQGITQNASRGMEAVEGIEGMDGIEGMGGIEAMEGMEGTE